MTIADAVMIIEAKVPSSEYYTIEVKYLRYAHQKPIIKYNIYSETRSHNKADTLSGALDLFQASAPPITNEIEHRVDELKELVSE